MSKFSRIYSRVLLQSLLTPLYFMNFDWLPFVRAFCDWSNGFWKYLGFVDVGFPPSGLQFMFRLRISCHMQFLS